MSFTHLTAKGTTMQIVIYVIGAIILLGLIPLGIMIKRHFFEETEFPEETRARVIPHRWEPPPTVDPNDLARMMGHLTPGEPAPVVPDPPPSVPIRPLHKDVENLGLADTWRLGSIPGIHDKSPDPAAEFRGVGRKAAQAVRAARPDFQSGGLPSPPRAVGVGGTMVLPQGVPSSPPEDPLADILEGYVADTPQDATPKDAMERFKAAWKNTDEATSPTTSLPSSGGTMRMERVVLPPEGVDRRQGRALKSGRGTFVGKPLAEDSNGKTHLGVRPKLRGDDET